MSFLLDEFDLEAYIDNVVVVPQVADKLKEYIKEIAQVKRLILYGVWDHIVSHIAGKKYCQAHVGCSRHVISGYFRAVKYVPRREVKAHLDAERGRHRPLPHQDSRGLKSLVNCWCNASTHGASEINT